MSFNEQVSIYQNKNAMLKILTLFVKQQTCSQKYTNSSRIVGWTPVILAISILQDTLDNTIPKAL